MKKAVYLFWQGLTGIIAGIANWFTVLLGMKDDSKYGRFIRRVVGSCFAFLMLLLAIAAGWDFCRTACYRLNIDFNEDDSDRYHTSQYLSRNATYYSYDYGESGYVRGRNRKKTLENVQWIAKPLGDDSLVCYSDGKLRGYFNMFTGKPVISPQYDHAWIFSDGLASVDDNGWIKFIDQTGNVIIDKHLPYTPGMAGYVFHNGLCIIHNERNGTVGLIDTTGKWLLEPEYHSIRQCDSLLIINNGTEESIMTTRLETIIPFTKASFWIYDDVIQATMQDHTLRQYDMQGNLIEDFYISDVEQMTYSTSELRYSTTKYYDENGNMTSEMEDNDPVFIQQTAGCLRYQAEYGWYGLLSYDGRVITPPSYTAITAIGHNLYLCESTDNYGILLNDKGQQVE